MTATAALGTLAVASPAAAGLSERHRRLEQAVLTPLTRATRGYWTVVCSLGAIVAWGLFAYLVQLRDGLIVTGMRDRVSWGLYITNFVFFIGISHAGTLLSAILRVTKAGWRVPMTRMAEFITVVALMVGALFPIIDLGRPDRALNLFLYGRWESPILWDVLSIFTYLTGSIIYLFLPLIPDLALCRDMISARMPRLKRWFYDTFAVDWYGTPRQRRRLALAVAMMMVIIIPVAVSVHTVVSWIFAMTLRAGWDSTVFGAYFVAGAIFSGIATIIVVMAVLRRAYHLEEFITLTQFQNLGYMLGAFTLIMAYFNLSEYVTIGYKLPQGDDVLLASLFVGPFAGYFWGYLVVGLLVPALLVFLPWTRTVAGIVIAAILVDVAMWTERYLIVVATLSVPLMPHAVPRYTPTWVEISIVAAALAGFALVIALFSRLFPVVSAWEVKEHDAEAPAPVRREPAAPRSRAAIAGVTLAGALLVALWLPSTARAQATGSRPVTLTITGPEQVPLGEPAHLVATLREAVGQPLAGARLVITSPASFAGTVGEMSLGELQTDAEGKAVLDYQLRIGGRNQFIARFHGDERHQPAEGKVVVRATGQAQLAERTAGIPLPRVGPVVLIAVLAGVWSIYLVAMLAVAGIARDGARAAADVVPAGEQR